LRKRHGLSFGLMGQTASERGLKSAQASSLGERLFPLDSGPDFEEDRDCEIVDLPQSLPM
jgi:hypothetical protein